ncbi:ATP-binding protein [Actinophytocola sediminis]
MHAAVAGALLRPRQLPREITHFTGRETELDKLDASLAHEQPSTVVISAIAGAPGIGKTSLALRWAHHRQDQFPDGQLYVNLRGYDTGPPLSPNHALESFLQALGLSHQHIPEDTDAKAGIYRSILAGRKILVLLDNAATPDQIRPLLPNEPACLVIVTSRNRLSGLVARDGAHRISLDVLTPHEASSLLKDIIGDRTDREQEATAELARRCDYLPLALRIAAERVANRPHLTIADLVHELAAEQRRLDILANDDDETTTVRTVFSWSYHALPNRTAEVFRLLGLQPGPTISLDAATALTSTSITQTRSHLDTLVSVNLLTETSDGRYQFHDLLRAYAAEQAITDEPAGLRDEATQRLYEWYLHTAHAALFSYYPQHPELPIDPQPRSCRSLAFIDRNHARGWFVDEYANLMALIRGAFDAGQYTAGWQLPQAFDCYVGNERTASDRIAIHELGLSSAQHVGHKLGEFWAHLSLGEAWAGARRHSDAIICLRRALAIAQDIGYTFGQGAALGDLAYSYVEVGRYADAAECAEQALDIDRSINHRRNQAITLIALGNALRGMGQLDQAFTHIHQGLDIATAIENKRCRGRCAAIPGEDPLRARPNQRLHRSPKAGHRVLPGRAHGAGSRGCAQRTRDNPQQRGLNRASPRSLARSSHHPHLSRPLQGRPRPGSDQHDRPTRRRPTGIIEGNERPMRNMRCNTDENSAVSPARLKIKRNRS